GHPLEQQPAQKQRHHHRHHEHGGCKDDRLAEPGTEQRARLQPALAQAVDGEEDDQRSELEADLDQLRLEFGPVDLIFELGVFACHQCFPAIAAANSAASTAAMLSTPSPTPMKCTGSPNFRAMATRMPPRAVPSSLVMTRPVTPALLPKIST